MTRRPCARPCSEDTLRLLSPPTILGDEYACRLHFTEQEIETEKEYVLPRISELVCLTGHCSLASRRGAGALNKEHSQPAFLLLSGRPCFPEDLGRGWSKPATQGPVTAARVTCCSLDKPRARHILLRRLAQSQLRHAAAWALDDPDPSAGRPQCR